VKGVLAGLARPVALEVVRGYLVKRVSRVSPDDLIKAIESEDVDLLAKASDRERRMFAAVARKYGQHAHLLTVRNVFQWLLEDLPFIAGILYGHPQGLRWLEGVLSRLRERARIYMGQAQPEVELVPVEASGSGKA
jgi:hypothetical protein